LTSLHHRITFLGVRTTVNLDQDVWRAAKAKADYEKKTLGAALSELARQGLAPSPSIDRRKNRLPQFTIPGGVIITSEVVDAALEDDANE